MVFESPGLTAMVPIPRALKADFPSGPTQVFPPLVDLYNPTPASQPLPQALASPVPTQIVLPLGSLGSMAIEPTALISNGVDRYLHWGWDCSALSVRQMPPPAAAIHILQPAFSPDLSPPPAPQLFAMASAVVRPPAEYSLGTYAMRKGVS